MHILDSLLDCDFSGSKHLRRHSPAVNCTRDVSLCLLSIILQHISTTLRHVRDLYYKLFIISSIAHGLTNRLVFPATAID